MLRSIKRISWSDHHFFAVGWLWSLMKIVHWVLFTTFFPLKYWGNVQRLGCKSAAWALWFSIGDCPWDVWKNIMCLHRYMAPLQQTSWVNPIEHEELLKQRNVAVLCFVYDRSSMGVHGLICIILRLRCRVPRWSNDFGDAGEAVECRPSTCSSCGLGWARHPWGWVVAEDQWRILRLSFPLSCSTRLGQKQTKGWVDKTCRQTPKSRPWQPSIAVASILWIRLPWPWGWNAGKKMAAWNLMFRFLLTNNLWRQDVISSMVSLEVKQLQTLNPEERQLAKRRLLLRWHPDKNAGTGAGNDLAKRVMQGLQVHPEWNQGTALP